MASITLDEDNNATEAPYRHGPGYVAEGIVFDREKLVNIFRCLWPTIPDAAKAARAAEVHPG